MSAYGRSRAERLDAGFCEQLQRLESRHQEIQREHDIARRRLESVTPEEAAELRNAWRQYCEVIDKLDEATAAFAQLRSGTR